MTNHRNISRILAAAIVSASATLLSAASVHATVNSEAQDARQVMTGNERTSSEENVRTYLQDERWFHTTAVAQKGASVRVSANSVRRVGVQQENGNAAPRRQTTAGQNGAGSLSNGGGQQPQFGNAAEEFKKFFEKMPKPHCGGKHSIC